MIADLIKKLKGKKLLIILLVLGIVIMIIPEVSEKNKQESRIKIDNVNKIEVESLERILKKIRGVKVCDVFVTYDNMGKTKFAYDIRGGANKDLEIKLSDDEPIIESVSNPEVRGVFAFLQGDGIDESEIAYIIKGATGVPLHRIYVKVSKGE